MKLMPVFLLIIQCAFLFADLPAGIDESQLAALFPISVLGIHNTDGSIPESVYNEIGDNFFNGITRIKRFKVNEYMGCTLSPLEMPAFVSYIKYRRKQEQLLYEEEAGIKEEHDEGKDIFEEVKEMSLEEIREEFGDEVATLVEKVRSEKESDADGEAISDTIADKAGEDTPESGRQYEYIFENLPVDIIDTLMTGQYLLVAAVSHYQTDSELTKTEEEELQEDEEGNTKRIIRTTITLDAHAKFNLYLNIIDTQACEIVMKDFNVISGNDTISRDYTRDAKEEKKDDSGNVLGKVLKRLLDIDDESDAADKTEKEIRKEIKSKRKSCKQKAGHNAAAHINDYLYRLLAGADVFHIDTTIVKVQGNLVFLNKGKRWDIGEGDEFLLNPGKKNEVFIRVEKAEKMYSIAHVLWGKPRENAVLFHRNRAHVNVELRGGVYNYIGVPDYNTIALGLATGSPVSDETEFQVWPYFSLWVDFELGYWFIIALDLGGAFSPYESDTFFFDGAAGVGFRFFMGKLTCETYVMAGAMLFIHEKQYSFSSAAALGLSPPGEEDILLSMQTMGCYVKPVIGISYFLIPDITLCLKADYRYNFIDAFFLIGEKEVSAEDSYNTRHFDDNSYFSLDGMTVTLSIILRF